jgi:hypothetical protein
MKRLTLSEYFINYIEPYNKVLSTHHFNSIYVYPLISSELGSQMKSVLYLHPEEEYKKNKPKILPLNHTHIPGSVCCVGSKNDFLGIEVKCADETGQFFFDEIQIQSYINSKFVQPEFFIFLSKENFSYFTFMEFRVELFPKIKSSKNVISQNEIDASGRDVFNLKSESTKAEQSFTTAINTLWSSKKTKLAS